MRLFIFYCLSLSSFSKVVTVLQRSWALFTRFWLTTWSFDLFSSEVLICVSRAAICVLYNIIWSNIYIKMIHKNALIKLFYSCFLRSFCWSSTLVLRNWFSEISFSFCCWKVVWFSFKLASRFDICSSRVVIFSLNYIH